MGLDEFIELEAQRIQLLRLGISSKTKQTLSIFRCQFRKIILVFGGKC